MVWAAKVAIPQRKIGFWSTFWARAAKVAVPQRKIGFWAIFWASAIVAAEGLAFNSLQTIEDARMMSAHSNLMSLQTIGDARMIPARKGIWTLYLDDLLFGNNESSDLKTKSAQETAAEPVPENPSVMKAHVARGAASQVRKGRIFWLSGEHLHIQVCMYVLVTCLQAWLLVIICELLTGLYWLLTNVDCPLTFAISVPQAPYISIIALLLSSSG